MKNKVHVLFICGKTTFVTYYTGDLKYLRDRLVMTADYLNPSLIATKIYDSIYFPVLNRKNTSLDLISIQYDLEYCSDNCESDSLSFDIFKRIIEQFGFYAKDMLISQKTKNK